MRCRAAPGRRVGRRKVLRTKKHRCNTPTSGSAPCAPLHDGRPAAWRRCCGWRLGTSRPARSPGRPSTALQNSLAPLPSAALPMDPPPHLPASPWHQRGSHSPARWCRSASCRCRRQRPGGSSSCGVATALRSSPRSRTTTRRSLRTPRASTRRASSRAVQTGRASLPRPVQTGRASLPRPYKPDAHLSPARTNPTRISPRASSRAVPLPPHRGPVCTEA